MAISRFATLSIVGFSLWAISASQELCSAGAECPTDSQVKGAEVNLLQTNFAVKEMKVAEAAGGSKILIIGDSNADFAGGGEYSPIPQNTLQIACKGSTVVNKGVGGTKISWWMAGNSTQIKNAVASGSGWTHVWVSIGGNDLGEDHACGPGGSGKNGLKANLANMISSIKALTTAQIVLTSYAVTAADDICTLEQMRANVADAMIEVAAADPKVTFASMATAADGIIDPVARQTNKCYNGLLPGTPPPASPTLKAMIGVPPCRGNKAFFHPDYIHLTAQGYAKAWALPAIQQAFGCQSSGGPPPPPTPPPPTPPPTPSPPATPAPPAGSCADDNAGITTYAASMSYTIPAPGGCAGVASFCEDETYGSTVKSYCKATCKVVGCPYPYPR